MKSRIADFFPGKIAGIAMLALTATFFFTSCKKESNPTTDMVEDEEVAEAVSQSVSASTGGLVVQVESSADMAGTTTLSCGSTSDTAVTGANLPGAVFKYNYSLALNRSLVCNNGIPSQFNVNFTGNSGYTAALMSSTDNSSAQFVLTGINPLATAYVMNGEYVRTGTQQSKVRQQRSLASTITITSADINVSKTTKKILSGTASVQFTGSASGGASVTKGGSISFLGNNQATLILNNSGTYQLQW